MVSFKNKFIEDAGELLSELEQVVLKLDKERNNSTFIEEIFRGMHTLKGTAGMYGFEKIGQLTHKLENIYDLIRNGRLSVNKSVLDLTLDIVDFLNKVLNDNENTSFNGQYNSFYEKINELPATVTGEYSQENNFEIEDNAQHPPGNNTWFICIKPDDDLRSRGVKIHTIFDEIDEIGHNQIFNRYYEIKSEKRVFWEIILATDKTKADIKDILLFIDDISEIKHLNEGNLFEIEEFINHLNTLEKEKATNIEELTGFIKNINEQNDKRKSEVNIPEATKIESIKVPPDRLDEQMTLLSELVTAKAEIQLLVKKHSYNHLAKSVETIEKITRRFRKNIFKIRLMPLETLQLRFDRLVRDLSDQLEKKVNFVTEGMNTELDKTIIDSLEKPLMHLIRNSLDHGIEPPEIRKARGKSGVGIIKLSAKQAAASVYITVSDDGEGIDGEKIRKKAVKKGYINSKEELKEQKIYDLIFKPGFSTAQTLTEVSGRGVGMDVVKQTISHLRGSIEVNSEKGKGSSFRIKLPLSLSIIDTMLVRSGKMFYSIPLVSIDKCTEILTKDINNYDNKYIKIEDRLFPYLKMNELMKVNSDFFTDYYNKPENERKAKIVIIKNEDKKTALIIDEVIGEHQAVLKPLGEYFKNQEYISGASLLADGQIALVLDTNKLINTN